MTKEKKIIFVVSVVAAAIFLVGLFRVFTLIDQRTKVAINDKPIDQIEITDEDKKSDTDPVTDDGTQPTTDDQASTSSESELVETPKEPSDELRRSVREWLDEAVKDIPQSIADVYKTVDECSKIADSEEKERCIILWAQYSLDKGLCDKVSEDKKEECFSTVISAMALDQGDPTLCSDINSDGYRSSCVYNTINSSDQWNGDCSSLSGSDMEVCSFFLAQEKNEEVDYCSFTDNQEEKSACQANYYPNKQ